MTLNRLDFLKLALAGLSASSIGILPMIFNAHRLEADATKNNRAMEPWAQGPEWLEKWKQAPLAGAWIETATQINPPRW